MFRSLGKSKIAFVLAILFGISLFFFRGGERYSNLFNSDNVVASVSGTPISTTKFIRTMQMNVNQYNQMFGRSLTSEEIQAFQIHSAALGQLINNAIFENEFDKKKYILDETVVASETKKRFPNLYDKNNKLNETSLNAFLSQQNLKIDDLVKIIDFEARSRVFDKLFFEHNYPSYLNKILNRHNNHSRNVDLLKFNLNDFELPEVENLDISNNNEKIKDYFNQNINSYINPEKRDISYILIDRNNFENQFSPLDNEMRAYYDSNKSLFLESEKRDFIQFNFREVEEASEFKLKISELDIQEIIKLANDNNIKFNDFSNVSSVEVLEELSSVIFNLKIGEVSKVVETALAKHLIIVKNIYTENQKTFEQSIEEISSTLIEVETNNYLLDLKNNISQEILDGFSLDEIASSNSLNVKSIKNAERQIDQIDNDLIKSEVIAKGFASNKDFVSDLIDIDDDKSIIVNVDEIYEQKPYILNDVFELVSNDWIKTLKIEAIEKKIDEATINTNSLKNIADYTSSEIINHDVRFDDLNYPSIFKTNVFKNEIDQIALSIADEEIYISKLKKISFPEKEENIQSISLLGELRGSFGNEIFKNKKISTNDNLIQALISQY